MLSLHTDVEVVWISFPDWWLGVTAIVVALAAFALWLIVRRLRSTRQ
jgi:hypothetical protein